MEKELYYNALETKALYKANEITREEAKKRLKEFEQYFNAKSKEIANKYGLKPKLFSFNSFMR